MQRNSSALPFIWIGPVSGYVVSVPRGSTYNQDTAKWKSYLVKITYGCKKAVVGNDSAMAREVCSFKRMPYHRPCSASGGLC